MTTDKSEIEDTVTETAVDDVIEDAVLVEDTSDTSGPSDEALMVHPMPVPVEEREERSIFLPLVLGGAIAAVIGFLASELELIGGSTNAETQHLRTQLEAQADQIDAQSALIKALETREPVVDLGPVTTLQEDVDQRFAAMTERMTEIENRPVVVNEGGQVVDTAAIEQELSALQSDILSQREEIARLINDARSVEEATEQAADTVSAQATLIRVLAAIDAGQPFDGPLQELTALEVVEVPASLGSVAADGVVTLTSLQDDFPDAARAALSVARANAEDDTSAGLGGFLKRQLGARSVAPREGDDPDAVLSRAEAAVRSGDLATALAELDGLSETTAEPLANWRDAAQARDAALTAANDLSQRLTAN